MNLGIAQVSKAKKIERATFDRFSPGIFLRGALPHGFTEAATCGLSGIIGI
jgi:hypothetical protein